MSLKKISTNVCGVIELIHLQKPEKNQQRRREEEPKIVRQKAWAKRYFVKKMSVHKDSYYLSSHWHICERTKTNQIMKDMKGKAGTEKKRKLKSF